MAARRWVLRFRLSDGAAGTKTRLEATTCFGTNASLRVYISISNLDTYMIYLCLSLGTGCM